MLAVAGLVALFHTTHTGGEVELEDGVTAFTVPRTFANGSAALPAGGELFVSEGGCLAVRDASGSSFLGLPSGAHADATGRAVIVGKDRRTGRDQRFEVGDVIDGGGGLSTAGGWEDEVRSRWPDAPQACLDGLSGVMSVTEVGGS